MSERRGLRSTIRPVVQRAGGLVDRVAPAPDGVTVLIYHRVGGGSGSAVDLDADAFDRQMAYLAEHHRVLRLDEALAEVVPTAGWTAAAGEDSDSIDIADRRRGVVVTFDDGTDDVIDVALPILARHRVPALLYVATRFVDEDEPFPWGAPPTSWTALADAVTDGWLEIGSHSHTHRLLDRLDPAAAAADLDRSIDLIGEHLGVPASHFAYPKAVAPSAPAEIEVRRRFRSAALASSRVNRPGRTDAHRLWRTPIQRSDTEELFARKADGGLRLEGELRTLLSRVRYRSAVT